MFSFADEVSRFFHAPREPEIDQRQRRRSSPATVDVSLFEQERSDQTDAREFRPIGGAKPD